MAAIAMQEGDALPKNLIVATVMANLGFRRALAARGIEVLTAQVGDKYVSEAMREHGAALGGEQSGHVIFGEHSSTGDGVLTGLMIAQMVGTSDRSLSEMTDVFETYPQVLINVPVANRDQLDDAAALWAKVAEAEAALGDDGRVLLRASGTEQIVRVMIEASDPKVASETAEDLAEVVRRELS